MTPRQGRRKIDPLKQKTGETTMITAIVIVILSVGAMGVAMAFAAYDGSWFE